MSLPHALYSRSCSIACVLVVFFSAPSAAADTNSSLVMHDAELYAALDVNRTLGVSAGTRGLYRATFFRRLEASAGISFVYTPSLDGYFISLRYENMFDIGLGAGISFIADIFPASLMAAHSIVPSLSYRSPFFFAEFGIAVRFLTTDSAGIWNIFYYASPVIEPLFHYQIGCTFSFFNDFWSIKASFGNFDEFYVGNFGTIMLRLRNEFLVFTPWRVFADITVRPAGSIALAGTYAVFYFTLGARVKL